MATKNKMERYTFSGNVYSLKEKEGDITFLMDIPTGKRQNKKEIIKEIRSPKGISNFFENAKYDKFRNKDEKLDLAIFLEVNSQRLKNQDLDNILKVVLDALQRDKKDSSWIYLYKNDSQIYRLIAWKVLTEKIEDYNTASVTISFRTYNPKEQMTMIYYREEENIPEGIV